MCPLELRVNPHGARQPYLAGLQRCFGGWGDEKQFRWWFEREVGAPQADLVVISAGDQPVAGIAVSYRRGVLDRELDELIGILGGAWTLPEFRRHGYFDAVMRAGRDVAGGRGARLVLAFAAAERSSTSAIARVADEHLDAWYIDGSPAARGAARGGGRSDPPADSELHRWFHRHRDGARIVYPATETFVEQARLRDRDTQVVPAGCGLWAIVGSSGSRTEALIAEEGPIDVGIAARALRSLPPSYTVDPELAAAARSAGAPLRAGFMFMFMTGHGEPLTSPKWWFIENLDRA